MFLFYRIRSRYFSSDRVCTLLKLFKFQDHFPWLFSRPFKVFLDLIGLALTFYKFLKLLCFRVFWPLTIQQTPPLVSTRMCAVGAVHALSSGVTNLTNKTLIFHDFQGLTIKFGSVTFQAWKMKSLNSMIFHDQYKPCSETDCSPLADGSFSRYLAGGRKRDHLPNTREKRPLFILIPRGGDPYLRNSGGGLHPRGVHLPSVMSKAWLSRLWIENFDLTPTHACVSICHTW